MHGIETLLMSFDHMAVAERPLSSHPAYENALAVANDILQNIADDKDPLFYDFAADFTSTANYFTDGIHVNAAGNQLKAKLIGDYILKQVDMSDANGFRLYLEPVVLNNEH